MSVTPQRPLGRYPLDHPDQSASGSVNEALVQAALNVLDSMPGGRAAASAAVLRQLGTGMRPEDFAALQRALENTPASVAD